jgi:hypothetical protein
MLEMTKLNGISNQGVCNDEDAPVVHVRMLLAHIVYLAEIDESGSDEHNQDEAEQQDREDGENLVLQALYGVIFVVEGERHD